VGNEKNVSKSNEKLRSTVYIEDETGEKVQGAYFLTLDSAHEVQHCFHIVSLFLGVIL